MVAWATMEWSVTPWGNPGGPVETVPQAEGTPLPYLKAELYDGTPLDVCIESGTITRQLDAGWRETATVQFVVLADKPPVDLLPRGTIIRLVAWRGTERINNWGLYRITLTPDMFEDNSQALQPKFTYGAEDWLAQMLRWTIMSTNTNRMSVNAGVNVIENVVQRAQHNPRPGATADYWEGVAYLCLHDITNGMIADIEVTNFTPLPPPDPRSTRNASPLRGLHFEPDATWIDVLGQLLNPDPATRAGWCWEGCTLTYDRDGLLHLRTARRRWSRGLGYSSDPGYEAQVVLHPANYTVRPGVPSADIVQILAPATSPPNWVATNQPPGTAKPYFPPAVLGSSRADTRWYTVIGNPRILKLPLLSPALIYNFNSNGDYTYLRAYAQNAADGAMQAILRDAYQLDLSLIPTAEYIDLTQDIDFVRPAIDGTQIVRSAFAVSHVTANMLPLTQTITGQWSADL